MVSVIAVSPAAAGRRRGGAAATVGCGLPCYASRATLAPMATTPCSNGSATAHATASTRPRPAVEAGAPWPLADRFDDVREARWGPREVLAHLAEMVAVLAGRDRARPAPARQEPVPFGRIATDADPHRRWSSGTGRCRLGELYDRIDDEPDALRSATGDADPDRARAARPPPEARRADGRRDGGTVHRRPPRRPRRPARDDPGGPDRPD